MSVAGLMLVRDEADIIERSVRHLASQVDAVYVLDNRSADGTSEILRGLRADGYIDRLIPDPEVGYFQSRKITALAGVARERGFKWVVPCDADELWYADGEGVTVREYLATVAPDTQIVQATLYDYVPPRGGFGDSHPFDAITWRRTAPGRFPKVAARTSARVVIEPGNHGANYGGAPALTIGGLHLAHFTWRTPEQYLRKIRNGIEAYAATDIEPGTGAHWRMFEGATDEAIIAHFHEWFEIDYPNLDPEYVYDPVSQPVEA